MAGISFTLKEQTRLCLLFFDDLMLRIMNWLRHDLLAELHRNSIAHMNRIAI
jgi:hypothetical protein